MFFVDSHCHLNFSKFADLGFSKRYDDYSLEAVVARAQEAEVKYMLTIGTEFSDINELRAIADLNENVFRTVGIHPDNAAEHLKNFSIDEISKKIFEQASDPKVVGVGEIGLDYHSSIDFIKEQQQLFATQTEAAIRCDLPISVHSRDAEGDTIAVIRQLPDAKGVIHCFSGSREFARQALDLGFFVSFSGIVTFKKSTELQEIAKFVPLDRLLIETDAPFLAPTPFRGKINEPAYVVHTAEKLAERLDQPLAKIAEQTSENFFKLFSKAAKYIEQSE